MEITKKKVIIITLIFLLIMFIIYFFSWNIKSVPKKEDDLYRIVNYNVKYAEDWLDEFVDRKNVIVEQLLSYEADIITLQEANYGWMNNYDGLPVLLENYSFVGVGREDGATSGEYAPIFYLTDKFEIVDSDTIWLSETPGEVSIGWDASTYRIMTSVTLENKITGEIFTINNTHLDHEGNLAVDESIELINETISENEFPYLLTGDMNVPSFFLDYYKFTKELDDTKKVAESSMKYGTINYNSNNKLFHFITIDYIFSSKNDFDIYNYRVDPSYLYMDKPVSDHFPIIVDFQLK